MLLGAVGGVLPERARLTAGWASGADSETAWAAHDGAALAAVRPWGVPALDREQRVATDPTSGAWLVVSGHVFQDRRGEWAGRPPHLAGALLERLLSRGIGAVADLDGQFALVWFDGRGILRLARDAFGSEPLYYASAGDTLLFGSRVRDLLATRLLPGGISARGLAEFLTYCYVPSEATLDRGVEQVPPGGVIEAEAGRSGVRRSRWHRLSFGGPLVRDEREIAGQFRALAEAAIVRRSGDPRPGVFLSGGMDSSTVLTFLRRHQPGDIRTYSYRCAVASFDESVYARAMARSAASEHHEVLLGPDEMLAVERVVSAMEVPFCDLGLEVATWMLGRAAGGTVDYALTGTGGDEIWASHPVYAAQRVVGAYERAPVPGFVDRALRRFAGSLPDSDRKRDLRVILKRLLPPAALPRELRHYRWKAYYTPADLEGLLQPEMAAAVRQEDPFRCIREGFEGYDGPDDQVTPCIYNDYVTLVPGFANRGRLLRAFGLEMRTPFLDRDLVEFGARFPTGLKLERVERTKRIFRQAMEGVLPDEINHRRDKLGLSIPLKNWLREDDRLAARLAAACSPDALAETGVFRPEAVEAMARRHRERRANESQRLWAILVLQCWLRGRTSRPDPIPPSTARGAHAL
jgi:asparagine synthase (glutamine-hydrolysing)